MHSYLVRMDCERRLLRLVVRVEEESQKKDGCEEGREGRGGGEEREREREKISYPNHWSGLVTSGTV